MTFGKWYITIGSLCVGFGAPPAHLWDVRLKRDDG